MQDPAALPWLWRELVPSGGGLAGKDSSSAAAGTSAGGGQGQRGGPSRLLSSLGEHLPQNNFLKVIMALLLLCCHLPGSPERSWNGQPQKGWSRTG